MCCSGCASGCPRCRGGRLYDGKVRRLLDGQDRAASAGAASQRAGEEASGGSPGSAAGAASQRAGEEASGDEESSGAASATADFWRWSPNTMD